MNVGIGVGGCAFAVGETVGEGDDDTGVGGDNGAADGDELLDALPWVPGKSLRVAWRGGGATLVGALLVMTSGTKSEGQGFPPRDAGRSCNRIKICTPLPQLTEQSLSLVQLLTEQSIGTTQVTTSHSCRSVSPPPADISKQVFPPRVGFRTTRRLRTCLPTPHVTLHAPHVVQAES
jgi:hypothetical protein